MTNNEPLGYKGMRKRLVEQIANRGIRSEKVLQAIGKIQRHLFVYAGSEHLAYKDIALNIDEKQTISQPFIVAYQTELLDIQKGDRILEIGTGSGYQACVLAEMEAEVFSVERIQKLHEKAKVFLPKIGYSTINLHFGDGFEGWQEMAPFDKIIVTAAAEKFPAKLGSQLKEGGKMVIPIGPHTEVQKLMFFQKKDEKTYLCTEASNVKFVPMLKGKK